MMNISQIKNTMTHVPLFLLISIFSLFVQEKIFANILMDDLQTTRDIIANEMQQVLNNEFRSWYPISIDTSCGGFFSDLDYEWKLDGRQNKMIVTQARHVWSKANAGMFFQKDNTLRNVAGHGVQFLKNKMWDKEFGGFFTLVSREGEPIKEFGENIKTAYGNAFAIYGLAAYC
jgi:mannobiose 2-epimerase